MATIIMIPLYFSSVKVLPLMEEKMEQKTKVTNMGKTSKDETLVKACWVKKLHMVNLPQVRRAY